MSQDIPLVSKIDIRIPDKEDSIFNFSVDFTGRWFTILSGTNGTGKSRVLKRIKETYDSQTVLYNPKRNTIKKKLNEAINNLEVGNRKKNNLLGELNKGWDDTNSIQYPSFQETIVAEYREKLSKDTSKSPDIILEEIKEEYTSIICSLFPDYTAVDWAISNLGPTFKIKKYGKYELDVDELSTGEQEILSLVFGIYSVKENYKILLIDEPEQHLNWALEINLFNFLENFAKKNNIQVIIATHSRAIFHDKFKNQCIYLFFDKDKQITSSSTVPDEIRKQIAGEAVKMLTVSKDLKTIYVEDTIHKTVVDKLAHLFSLEEKVNSIKASNRDNVISLYKNTLQDPNNPAFKNCFYLIDGDNKKSEYKNDNRFISLDKNKCMETYFLDFDILSKISAKKKTVIKKHFCSLINSLKRGKGNDNLLFIGRVSEASLTQKIISRFDPKEIWELFINTLGYKTEGELIDKYLSYVVADKNRFKKVFDSKLVDFFIN